MRNQPLTNERKARIFHDTQSVAILAEVIQVTHSINLVDTNFKNPAINNLASRIRKDAEAIQLHCSSLIKFKDRSFTEDYAAEIHVITEFLFTMSIDQLREFREGVEQIKKMEAAA